MTTERYAFYAGAAVFSNGVRHNYTSLGFLQASSQYEALGMAEAIARKCYPVKDGWRDHHSYARSVADAPDVTVETAHVAGLS